MPAGSSAFPNSFPPFSFPERSPFLPAGKEGVFRAAPETAGEAAGLTDWAYGISHMGAAIRTDLNGTLCVATKKGDA